MKLIEITELQDAYKEYIWSNSTCAFAFSILRCNHDLWKCGSLISPPFNTLFANRHDLEV